MVNFILRLFMAMLLFASTCTEAVSASYTQYSALAQKYDKMSSEQIMAAAEKHEEAEDNERAIVLYTIVTNRFSNNLSESEKQKCILAYVKLGILYVKIGSYIKALDSEIEGIKKAKLCKDKKYNSQLYNVIGNIYSYYFDYEKAINYYKKGYAYCSRYPDKETEFKILSNLTNLNIITDHISEAKKYHRKAEAIRDLKNPQHTYLSNYAKGLIEMKEGKYKDVVKRFKFLASFAIKNDLDAQAICFAYQKIYVAYMKLDEQDSVVKYLRICYDEANKRNVLFRFIGTPRQLAEICEKNGDIKSANKYRAIYINIKDSMQNIRQFDIAKNKLFLHEVEETTKELDTLHKSEEENTRTIRIQWVIMGGIFLFMVCIAVLLVIVSRQKKQLNESYHSLFRQNKDNLEMQKRLERRYKETSAELEKKNRLIDELQARHDGHSEAKAEQAAKDTSEKYQSSNLNEEGRKIIERRIEKVMEETTEFCSMDFSLDRLAELVGSNSKYVSQVINDSFKKNYNAFVNSYRIQMARERLIDVEKYGNYTIKGIAESVGFKSPTTFINVFKKTVGLTPSMYQNMAKNDMKNS